MILEKKSEIVFLKHWVEVVGPLYHLEVREDTLLADIGTHTVAFPAELKEALHSQLGMRIAILRTDIPGKEYLFRVLPEGETSLKLENATVRSNCGNNQVTSYSEAI